MTGSPGSQDHRVHHLMTGSPGTQDHRVPSNKPVKYAEGVPYHGKHTDVMSQEQYNDRVRTHNAIRSALPPADFSRTPVMSPAYEKRPESMYERSLLQSFDQQDRSFNSPLRHANSSSARVELQLQRPDAESQRSNALSQSVGALSQSLSDLSQFITPLSHSKGIQAQPNIRATSPQRTIPRPTSTDTSQRGKIAYTVTRQIDETKKTNSLQQQPMQPFVRPSIQGVPQVPPPNVVRGAGSSHSGSSGENGASLRGKILRDIVELDARADDENVKIVAGVIPLTAPVGLVAQVCVCVCMYVCIIPLASHADK
jgi:hypothetical protein